MRSSLAEKKANEPADAREAETESMLIKASAKLKPKMHSAHEYALPGRSSFRESTRLLRSTTPTPVPTATSAAGLGRHSFISSTMHRLSTNPSTLTTRGNYNQSSESTRPLVAQFENMAAYQDPRVDENELTPAVQTDLFRGMTPSSTPGQVPPPSAPVCRQRGRAWWNQSACLTADDVVVCVCTALSAVNCCRRSYRAANQMNVFRTAKSQVQVVPITH